MEDLHQVDFRRRINDRHCNEDYVRCIHITINDLKCNYSNTYFDKTVEPDENSRYPVPHYPWPVEFHVSTLSHATDLKGLCGILQCDGFKGGDRTGVLCWGLEIGGEEISNAEERYLEKLFSIRSPEEKERQRPFLAHFTTSPEFLEESRYGNFRFSFSLADVLQAYSTQLCRGKSPVLRVYETVIYKKEVMYVVLIHSPDVHDYDDYPVLGDNDDGVCAYRDGEIIWCAQAISETHKFRLIENRYKKHVHVEDAWSQFYVWDHVTLHFHLPKSKILRYPHEKLLEALSACDAIPLYLNDPLTDKAEAEKIVQKFKGM